MAEIIIYQARNQTLSTWQAGGVKINLLDGLTLKTPSHAGRFYLGMAKALAFAGLALLAIYFAPGAVAFAKSTLGKAVANYKLSSSEVQELTRTAQKSVARTLPPFDPTLPLTNRLVIPKIGVDADIEEATYDNYEAALKKGVWRVSDFGEPDIAGASMILAAHRFGYLAWTNAFRHKSSFYNLPKVEIGDTITVDWQQREYTYGVYKVETAESITDYSADVILYTCESLSGPERVFVYGRLIS
jgi:LPXTG-site transpeptidase (sortase) family protein